MATGASWTNRLRKPALTLALLASLSACSPVYTNHGYIPTEQDLAQISVGKTTREEAVSLLGHPASSGVLEGSGLYYVASNWVRKGILPSRETRREVLALSFDESGKLANVERFGLEGGEVVVLSQRVTDSNIKGVSAVRQILSGFGRMNASDVTAD